MINLINRRSFLIGSGAAIATAIAATQVTITPGECLSFLGEPVKTITGSYHRIVFDMLFGTNESCDDIVELTLLRNNSHLLQISLNCRASFRWVAAPKSEIIFHKEHALHLSTQTFTRKIIGGRSKMVPRPCYDTMRCNLLSYDEKGEAWSEIYNWHKSMPVLVTRERLNTNVPDGSDDEWS